MAKKIQASKTTTKAEAPSQLATAYAARLARQVTQELNGGRAASRLPKKKVRTAAK